MIRPFTTYNLCIQCDTDWTLQMRFRDGDGEYIDLEGEGYAADLDIRRDGELLVEANASVEGTTLTLELRAVDLPNSLAGTASYDLLLWRFDGSVSVAGSIRRPLSGLVELVAGVSDGQ